MRPVVVSRMVACAVAMAVGAGARAEAQQRPLVTQDPEVIGDGRLLVESGFETGATIWYPVSGLTGDRVAIPVGVSLGLGNVTELQIDSGYQWLAIERRDFAPLDFRVHPGDHTSDVIDVTLGMKVRVLAEGARRPGVGLRFATELPNASNESGLGLDTLNFVGAILVGQRQLEVRLDDRERRPQLVRRVRHEAPLRREREIELRVPRDQPAQLPTRVTARAEHSDRNFMHRECITLHSLPVNDPFGLLARGARRC